MVNNGAPLPPAPMYGYATLPPMQIRHYKDFLHYERNRVICIYGIISPCKKGKTGMDYL